MKTRLPLIALVLATLILLAGCMTLGEMQRTNQATQTHQEEATQVVVGLQTSLLKLRATTQPTSTPEAIKAEAEAEKPVVAAMEVITAKIAEVEAARTQSHNAQIPINPAPVIRDATTGDPKTLGFWLTLSGSIAGIVIADQLRRRANTRERQKDSELVAAKGAGQSVLDAVELLISSGKLVRTSADAVTVADNRINDHPLSNQLTDIIAAAPLATPPEEKK